jgi:hypothetical protein
MARKFSINNLKVPKGLKIIIAIGAILLIVTMAAFLLVRVITTTADLTGLKQQIVTNCTDTDNGKVSMTFGTCADYTRKTYSDTCVLTGVREPLKLQEWFCENNTCKSETSSCESSYACVAGQCIKS